MFFLLKKFGFTFFLTSWFFFAAAQRIDHNATFNSTGHQKYLRFHYDNDFFTKTDFYYTQGIVLEYADPVLKKFILFKLIPMPAGDARYSLGLNLSSYSPTSISSNNILYGDRPFSAIIAVSTNAVVTNYQRASRLASSITLGVIGPAAQGKEIQTGIHRWLKNIVPYGWQHQVKNDVIINYDFNYEKKLPGGGDHFLLNGTAAISIGTFTNKLRGGFNFIAGNFNDPYNIESSTRKKLRYHIYGQARANLVGYDATMQGGLFNRHSPYTIYKDEIMRTTFQADAGIVVHFKKITLSYSQSFLTREFKKGRHHRWGGISVGIAL